MLLCRSYRLLVRLFTAPCRYVEFHSTGAAAVVVNELLQILDSEDGSVVRTLGNVTTAYPDGVLGPP